MIPNERKKPLTEIEKADLFVACDKVLKPQGMNLLRRLMFENDQLRNNRYTIEEIKNYILSQDSLGDVMYNLKHENIRGIK